MNRTIKIFILRIILSGGIYALGMAGLDWREENEFDAGRFVFNLLFFGLIMALVNWWIDNRYNKKSIRKDI